MAYGVNTEVVGRALKKLGWTKKRSLSPKIKGLSKKREISVGSPSINLEKWLLLRGIASVAFWRLGRRTITAQMRGMYSASDG